MTENEKMQGAAAPWVFVDHLHTGEGADERCVDGNPICVDLIEAWSTPVDTVRGSAWRWASAGM